MNTPPTSIQLAQAVGAQLLSRNQRVTTAESCTGGLIAAAITDIPGSSSWFDQGFVTYSNLAKQQMLGVSKVLLEQQGAVSEAVVRAMAAGALSLAGADFAIAVSGVAGPGGGSVAKPVGTVWLAWASTREVTARCFLLPGDRIAVRQASVICALEGLLKLLK